MHQLKILNKKKVDLNIILTFLFISFPIAIILGNLLINIFIFIISILYLIKNFNRSLVVNKTFLLLTLLLFSLVINLFFTQNIDLSYQRVLKFFFIIFFVLSFQYLINQNKSYDKIIFKSWFYILSIVVLDLIIEFNLGYNSLGMKSYMPGRLAGFFNDELVVGYFYLGFIFFSFSFLYKKYHSSKLFVIFLYFFIIFISLIIGERSNLIKLFIGISIIIFLILELSIVKKVIFSLLIVIVSITFILSNQSYKVRYYDQLKVFFQPQGLDQYLKSSEYGAHYNTAYKMFQQNKIFGVGIKNFK